MSLTHGFLISAPQSSCGKTTVSLAIMAAFSRRGMKVAPFKCGPDFIDPGYHQLVTGHPSVNLDSWICPEAFVHDTFLHHSGSADIAIIEGVMGLFDGLGSEAMNGSSAQIAALTNAPVLLVINARGMAASAAALAKGFAEFDPQVRLAGVIFNNVGSQSHADLLKEALTSHCPEITCFGCIPRDELLAIPSRHLGLVTAEDNQLSHEFIGRLADTAERCLDLDLLATLEISGTDRFGMIGRENGADAAGVCVDTSRTAATCSRSERPKMTAPRIAVARDAAFCFMYEDNLRLLRAAGAEVTFFSPLIDKALPADIQGIYLPGGYPELYADKLGQNLQMKNAIRGAVAADMPLYAECGGFIYLTEGIEESENQLAADFVGAFPVRCRMLKRRKSLGYRQVEMTDNVIVGAKGAIVRGHEFHYSEIEPMPDVIERAYLVSRRETALGKEGFRTRNCLASYIHLHFGSNPDIAPTFVALCREFLKEKTP